MPISRLVNGGLVVGEDVFDGVFECDDVDGLALVHIVEHRGDRGGLAGAGDARKENDSLRLHGDLGHDVGEVEILEAADVGGDETGGDGELAARLEEVDAEAVALVVVVGEVDGPVLVEIGELLLGEDVLGDGDELIV